MSKKDKGINPVVAGAGIAAAGLIGAAVATALTDKKTRGKILKGVNDAKKVALDHVHDMQTKGEELEKKAEKVLDQKVDEVRDDLGVKRTSSKN